jgi:hypothetical protein
MTALELRGSLLVAEDGSLDMPSMSAALFVVHQPFLVGVVRSVGRLNASRTSMHLPSVLAITSQIERLAVLAC